MKRTVSTNDESSGGTSPLSPAATRAAAAARRPGRRQSRSPLLLPGEPALDRPPRNELACTKERKPRFQSVDSECVFGELDAVSGLDSTADH